MTPITNMRCDRSGSPPPSIVTFLLLQSPTKTMRKLEQTQSLMLTNFLSASKQGCPEVSLYLEMTSLTIKNQIILRQMLFLHHMATLPKDSLASACYEEMIKYSLPNVVSNSMEILRQWGITDIQQYSKWSWRKLMKEKKNRRIQRNF